MSPDNRHKICVFCNDPEDNEIKYGKIYEHNGIITHYYCLLLSSNMQQRGEDDEGILGFLPADINRELNRGKKLVCSFCKRKGATLGCVNKKCKKVFHLPCGLRNNTLHQFFDQFKSFCQTHRPKQHIELNVLKSTSERTTCWICFDSASRHDIYKTLWAPCCKKNAWFHRDCVQQLALSAGYFFKCPLCNNKKEFQSAMQECGIFVPSQDASWELVPNAFQELLYRHNRCDAADCKCPQGRDFTSGSSWQMVLCRTCGSQGTHLICGNLRWAKTWDCRDCQSILSKKFTDNTARFNGNSHVDSSNDVSIDSDDDDDQDHSLSSSSSRTIDIAAINLKPGPRSAKLKQLHQTAKQLPEPATIEQLKNILDEQQAQSSQSQVSQVPQISQALKITQKPEEEEISILEVKSKPQNSPDKIIQVNKYPELSISPRKSLPEASNNTKQNISNKPESRLISIPGTSVQSIMSLPVSTGSPSQPERALVAPTRPRQSLLKINQKSTTQSPVKPKIVEDVIVVDSDDESEQAKIPANPIELNHPVIHDLEPEDGIMNIKITEVTSLAPEVFAQVPDNSIINLPSSIDNYSENSTTPVNSKRKADTPSILSTFVNRVNNVIDKNARELELASVPSKKTKYFPSTVTNPSPAPSNPSNFSTGMTRIVPPPNYMINNPISYNRGISLANSAVVKVYDKQYIVPLEDPTPKDQISYDGDAGTEPACQFTLPTTTTTTTTAAIAEQSIPETYSSLSPSSPCSSASAPREQLSTGIRTSRAEQNIVSTIEGLSTSTGNNAATSLSGAARTTITTTKKFNPSIDQRNSSRSDRFGLDQKILLRNLKFRVCSDNSLEITAYDNYRMNLGISGPKLSPSNLGISSGLKNVCVVKPRSSRVRGPKSKRMKYEMENLLSNSIVDNTDNLFGASASVPKAPANPVAVVTPQSGNTSEYNYHQTAKENLIPKLNHSNFDTDKQSDDHTDDYKFIGRKLRSSKFLEDIQYNKNSLKSQGIDVNNEENNLKNQQKISCFVSIDLNRIKPLIDSKPNLFVKKTQSFDKLFYLNDNEFIKLNETNGKLKRSYSCDSIFPINISSKSETISTTISAATVSIPIEEKNNKEEIETPEHSQKTRKRKRGRSFKNSSRVR